MSVFLFQSRAYERFSLSKFVYFENNSWYCSWSKFHRFPSLVSFSLISILCSSNKWKLKSKLLFNKSISHFRVKKHDCAYGTLGITEEHSSQSLLNFRNELWETVNILYNMLAWVRCWFYLHALAFIISWLPCTLL